MSEASAPAGWYPDPAAPGQLGYWNGASWTGHRAPVTPPYAEVPPKAPEGTAPYTPFIWLMVMLPLVPLTVLLFVPWGSLFQFDPALYAVDPYGATLHMYQVLRSPLYWLAVGSGLVVYALNVVFAFLDRRALLARGVPQPFHWAWAFINSVYPVGRTIIVARRTGHGWAPLWVLVGTVVVALAVGAYISTEALLAMLSSLRDLPLYVR